MALKKSKSFKGYSFLVALKRNKNLIKAYIAIIGGLNLMPPFDWNTLFLTAGVGLFALLTKIASDAVDFYTSEVKL